MTDFLKYYYCLNNTYNLYSPDAQPLDKRFKGWKKEDEEKGLGSLCVGG